LVKGTLFLQDHTHTNMEGAKMNAALVAEGLQHHKNLLLNRYRKI